MRTARSLTVSRRILCMPPHKHACPPATMHAPLQPHMPPPHNHACPLQPCTPPTTMYAPNNHACPPQPCTPPTTMHAPGNHACPPLWTEWQTGVKNITLPQTSFAGGNKYVKCNKSWKQSEMHDTGTALNSYGDTVYFRRIENDQGYYVT